MAILLTLTESTNQLIAGIPEKVTITTNIPSTIFYTLDGTDPDITSDMYVSPIYLPTTENTVTLKVFAISGAIQSSIVEEIYSTDQSEIAKRRLTASEGVVVLAAGDSSINNLSYDVNDQETQGSSTAFSELDIQASETNEFGEDISGDTTVDFINFPTILRASDPPAISSPNEVVSGTVSFPGHYTEFDPKSAMIIIRGTTEEEIEGQVVKIINRSHMSMNLESDFYKNDLNRRQLVSSSLVRPLVNPATGLVVFYYRDSRENRWIKSIQSVNEPTALKLIPPSIGAPDSVVFRWIENRTQTRLF